MQPHSLGTQEFIMMTNQEIATFLHTQVERWNAGDHDALMAGYREGGPAGMTLEFPIGSPVVDGFPMMEGIWQAHAGHVKLRIETCIVNAGEGALCVANQRFDAAGNVESVNMSIELYKFNADGTLHIRWFNAAIA
jgi:hypothetical protein